MLTQLLSKLNHQPPTTTILLLLRRKTTSAEYVASRNRDPTFEKLMDKYKNLFKVISIQNLILGTTTTNNATASPPAVSVDFLNRLSQRLHLNRGATHFLRKYPHIFHIFHHPTKLQPFCTLTESALKITQQEAAAINASLPLVINRLVRMLSMSVTKTLPLRAIFKVFRELGLPDDFEDSVILKKSNLFALVDSGIEPNTHLLKLVGDVIPKSELVAAVDSWRVMECCKEDVGVDRNEILYSFKHSYPPGMKLRRSFKAKVKEWEKLKYVGPYEAVEIGEKRKSKIGTMEMEKRAVGIVHEFLSLTVEKMVEVEKISHFRKWFGIDLNIRDLFLDHPGIFYLSTKGYRHTVFLREAYERGCLIEPNPVYEARRKLFDLVILGRRGLSRGHSEPTSVRQGDDGIDELKTDSDED
ncbi:protein ROOT PRIMORDIUM DEFECTIVE 1 [Nicotiana sylvestris]|uniref:Protein ROOT PRIMORDIUM DEFECTIVE 1 n=1 Tax=Nicotiana sylvestris TaxID=4096 RepID=A0A1U7Y5M4_NICSY|nr:PREDICTED: protein ROOT PRIMORDIUM DEFECTIVE 1 [Nicotiana sylvestris]XP_009794090.1 PREDICTED: protein ROOT PRIMORDIUM DEFECTIVE 1 [Nicotiana sylvestris]